MFKNFKHFLKTKKHYIKHGLYGFRPFTTLKPAKYVFILLKFLKYAVICIYVKIGQNMQLHMQVCKCITIRSLVITDQIEIQICFI
jgi:hypothetical protein